MKKTNLKKAKKKVARKAAGSRRPLKGKKNLSGKSAKTRAKSASASQAREAALKRIPRHVENFLKDLQRQLQSGAIDLADWRSLGIGILNRMGQVTSSLRKDMVARAPLKRAKAITGKASRRRAKS